MTCTKCRCERPSILFDNSIHVSDGDNNISALLGLAQKEGWQGCYRCGIIVECTNGCDRIRYSLHKCRICNANNLIKIPLLCPFLFQVRVDVEDLRWLQLP